MCSGVFLTDYAKDFGFKSWKLTNILIGGHPTHFPKIKIFIGMNNIKIMGGGINKEAIGQSEQSETKKIMSSADTNSKLQTTPVLHIRPKQLEREKEDVRIDYSPFSLMILYSN